MLFDIQRVGPSTGMPTRTQQEIFLHVPMRLTEIRNRFYYFHQPRKNVLNLRLILSTLLIDFKLL